MMKVEDNRPAIIGEGRSYVDDGRLSRVSDERVNIIATFLPPPSVSPGHIVRLLANPSPRLGVNIAYPWLKCACCVVLPCRSDSGSGSIGGTRLASLGLPQRNRWHLRETI